MLKIIQRKFKSGIYRLRRLLVNTFGNKSGNTAIRNLWDDVQKYLPPDSVLVDGGAFEGGTTELFLDKYNPSRVYAFEPNPVLADNLRRKFDSRVSIIEKALGNSCGTIPFNISKYSASSSILPHSKASGRISETQSQIIVPLTTLDVELKNETEIGLLKLDLEGYDLEALKGATETLKKTKVVICETLFADLYDGAPRFSEIELYMRSQGFELINIYDTFTRDNGRLSVGDSLFVKNGL